MYIKNIIILCATIFVLFSFTGCTSSKQIEPDISSIMSQINSQISFPEMVDISIDRVDDYYEIDVESIEDVQLIIAGSGASPEEILVVKFDSTSNAIDFEAKMNNRLNQITTLFNNYGTDESADYIDNCKIIVKNKYAFLAICQDSDVALQIFNDAFNA